MSSSTSVDRVRVFFKRAKLREDEGKVERIKNYIVGGKTLGLYIYFIPDSKLTKDVVDEMVGGFDPLEYEVTLEDMRDQDSTDDDDDDDDEGKKCIRVYLPDESKETYDDAN